MPTGSLVVSVTDMVGEPVNTDVNLDFARLSGEPGTGGDSMEATSPAGVTDLTIRDIRCRGGIGTMYRVLVTTPHFRPYAFLQLIKEDLDNQASDDVEFWVKPGDVSDIRAPAFGNLPAGVRGLLGAASMREVLPEDRDLLGLTGQGLYDSLGPLRKACLLNVAHKAAHPATAGNSFQFVRGLLIARQDRFFAMVDPAFPDFLVQSELYTSENPALHDPLEGFRLTGQSFKSRDAHANLQVTFMKNATTGELAADIDIDEASGIKHGFEVIRNALFKNRTNPYLIREFLVSADPIHRTLNPGYRFVF